MGDFYGVCALLAALMFFVLIQKFDKKFGKVEKELDEIKKRMDAFLKAQERIASDHVQSRRKMYRLKPWKTHVSRPMRQ